MEGESSEKQEEVEERQGEEIREGEGGGEKKRERGRREEEGMTRGRRKGSKKERQDGTNAVITGTNINRSSTYHIQALISHSVLCYYSYCATFYYKKINLYRFSKDCLMTL